MQKTQSSKNLKPQSAGNTSKSNISRISSLYQIKNHREKYTQEQNKQYPSDSRQLDNHIYKPHLDPWLAIGITPAYKYDFGDSGLGYIVKDKYQVKLNEARSKIQEQRKKEEVKSYPELKSVKDKDVVVIIEYCNDCQSHQGTTKHDEEQYLRLANSYKQQILRHFPVAKVFMKPVREDPHASSLQNIYVRQRIGAFEIYVQSKSQGEVKKGCIHSKLKTGRWPNETNVLNQLCQYMVTCTLSVSFSLCDFDLGELGEEEFLTKKNKLNDIQVTLRPYREKQLTSASQTNITMNTYNNTSQTRMSRPVSGISRRSDSDSKFINTNTSLFTDEQSKKNDSFQGKTDKHGLVIFEDIPSDVYILEVKETNNFKSIRECVNIFELQKNKQQLDLHYELQHYNLTFLSITAFFKSLKDNKVEQLKNATIKINSYDEKDQLIVEPIVEESFEGVFQIQLEPGQYLIKIEKDGHQTIEQQYWAQPGQQELEFPPVTKYIDDEPKKEMDSKTRFQNRPSSSARKGILKSSESQSQKINGKQSESVVNNEEGQINQNQSPQPASVKIQEQQNNTRFSNGSANNQSMQESPKQSQRQPARPLSSNPAKKSSQDNSIISQQQVSSPEKLSDDWSFNKIEKLKLNDKSLLKPPKKSSEVKLTGFCNSNIIEFNVITPDNNHYSQNADNLIIQNEVSNNKIGLWIQDSKKHESGVYRVFAKILNNKQFNGNNIKVYASSSTSTSFLQIPQIENADAQSQLYWDIGIFDVKLQKFFEINNYTAQPITRDYLLESFECLLNYLSASRGEIKKILGFDSQDKQVYDDDVYVKKETILKSLENYEFEGSSQISHFLQSSSNHKGYFSFKKLEQKFIHKDIEQNSYRFVESSLNGKKKYDDDDEDENYQEDYDDV